MANGTLSTLMLHDNNVASIKRISSNVTTGVTGNIVLSEINDGYTYVISALVNGAPAAAFRIWVSTSNGHWVLTAIDPNSGNTINSTAMQLRYIVLKIRSIS